jgi:hypothetical protein
MEQWRTLDPSAVHTYSTQQYVSISSENKYIR